jgi:hypothetical protein
LARNSIDLDKIRSRLGDLDKAPERDPYDSDDLGGGSGGGGDNGDDEGSTLNAAFIATVGAICLTLFGGTFFMLGGMSFPSFGNLSWNAEPKVLVSSVDRDCKLREWVPETINDTIAHCYLTKNVLRLCKPEEQAALVATVERFEEDKSAFDRNLRLSVLNMAVITPVADKMQLGLEAAKMNHSATQEEALKHEENAVNLAQGMMAGTNAVLKRQKYIQWGMPSIQDSLQELGQKGLISLNDFSYYPPSWVKEALQNVKVTSQPCKK